jgi:hypothetical protein
MTAENGPQDGHQDGPGRALSADEELSVTRALRELPAPAVPPALAARLDARLAELQAERTPDGSLHAVAGDGSTADGVTARDVSAQGATAQKADRRAAARRRWPRLVLAAAAVLVGGYAVGSALDGTLGGGGSSSSADSATAGSAGSADSRRLEHGASVRPVHDVGVTLHQDTLRADLRRVLRAGGSLDGGQRNAAPSSGALPRRGCHLPASLGPGTVWQVRYEGGPALLVTHRRPAGRVHATVIPCGGASPGVRVTLRVP